MLQGKGFMVWRLRDWKEGNPLLQVAHAKALGLSWVSVKINDGVREKWEGLRSIQNADLLLGLAEKLSEAGIELVGWGWPRGRVGGISGHATGVPSAGRARQEAAKTVELCERYGIKHYQVDAEIEWRSAAMASVATAYSEELNRVGPQIEYSLCSYRFPLTHQPNFPVRQFAPHMDAWCPQVYFLGDNRPNGGAIQLEISARQHIEQVRNLPYFGIGPTYPWGSWRASAEQLTRFMQRAKDLGHPAVGFWDLPQASAEQLQAVSQFEWEPPAPDPPDPPAPKITVEVHVPAGVVAGEIDVEVHRKEA